MVAEEDESFEGLTEHLQNVFQSGDTLSKLLRNVYGHVQKTRKTEDTFTDDTQVLARRIIECKPSFCLVTNQQQKTQYMHNLWDPYYAAMACSVLQSSPEEGIFNKLLGCLVTIFQDALSRASLQLPLQALTTIHAK